MRSGDAGTGLFQQLFKLPIAEIAEENARTFERVVGELGFDLGINAAGDPEQVGVAVVVEIVDARAPAYVAGFDAEAGGVGDVLEIAFSVVAVEHGSVIGEVRFQDVDRAIEVIVADADAHAGLLHAVLVQGNAGFETRFGKGAVAIIFEEKAGGGVTGDIDFGPAVVIEIGSHGGHAVAALCLGDAGLLADIGEGTVAIVVIEGGNAGGQAARAAVDRNSFPIAVRVFAGLRNRFGVELEVVGDEEIEAAVAVVIDEGAAGAPTISGMKKSGLLRDIGEGAVAIVVIEDVLAPVGQKQIVEAVVIVVADGNGGGPSVASEAGFFGDVDKGTVAIVFVEAVGGSRRRAFQTGAAEKKNVEPAIVVVVDKRAATADRFDDVGFFRFAAVDDGRVEAGLRRDVDKMSTEGQPRRFSPGLRFHLTRGNALCPGPGNGGSQQGETGPPC